MTIKEELRDDVREIFRSQWSTTDRTTIPVPEDLRLGNDAAHFDEMTVLYADINGSTSMVDNHTWGISAEVYKTYLHCAAKLIKAEGGTITAYDGDRVMAVFIGDAKNTSAVRCALMINTLVLDIINPALKAQYSWLNLTLKHSIGIDTSEIHVARIGVRNDNDLVWIGRAANHAAKLTTLPEYPIWITSDVFTSMNASLKTYATTGIDAWEQRWWTSMNNATIYRTDAMWNFGNS